MNYDTIVIGAGFAGIVIAERLASINGENVLLIEQRNHIGGNCYDFYDDHGILIHKFGPHIFHTDNKQVWNYLSYFTDWHHYQHKVLGQIDGQEVPIPFNLNTLYNLVSNKLASRIEEKLICEFGFGRRLPIKELQQSKDEDLQFFSRFIHEKVFFNYTIKHWGMKPEEVSSEVFARVPIVISKDDRYFHDRFQGLPKYGYTRMFEKMLDHPNIKILLNTPMHEIIEIHSDTGNILFMGRSFNGKLIFTGMIDSLFNYKFGELPYRSLKFEFETIQKKYSQKAAVINYPNNYDFTRITEFKHMTGQKHHLTTILREYPCQYQKDDPDKNVPCYPILTSENQTMLGKYMDLIKRFDHIIPLGRLAEYKYYDMDDMVEKALMVVKNKFLTS